jgi:hypothetical protein
MNLEEGSADLSPDPHDTRPKVSRTKWFILGGCGAVLVLALICFVGFLLAINAVGGQPGIVEMDLTTAATLPPEMQSTVQTMMDLQEQGLDGADIAVYKAYNYHGFSWMEPIEEAKLAAVDISFANYGDGIDPDDIEIVDGKSDETFGSGPDIVFLTDDGVPFPDNQPTQDFGEPIRVLLIYAVRDSTESIKLRYWGKEIVAEPLLLEEDGLALPEP